MGFDPQGLTLALDSEAYQHTSKLSIRPMIIIIRQNNIDCGYALGGGSNENPQSIVWSKNKKNRYTPAYPSFAI